MALKYADLMKGSKSRAIADIKVGNYKGLAVRKVSLENGKVGLIGEDQFDDFMAKNLEDIKGEAHLKAECRLTNKGFWTDRPKSDDSEGFQAA